MNLRNRLSIFMALIGLLILGSLSTIFNSTSDVGETADQQKIQVLKQNELVVTLKAQASKVAPAVDLMNQISNIQRELFSVQYAFANASLTLTNTDLVAANKAMKQLEPKVLSFLNKFPSISNQIPAVKDAFYAANVYGNKMNDFLLDDLSAIAGDMAVGLNQQVGIISKVLDELSQQSTKDVNNNIRDVVSEINQVNTSADLVSQGVDKIIDKVASVSQLVFIVGIVVIGISMLLVVSFTHSLKSATKQVASNLTEISRNKNLSLRINRSQQDEFGLIANDVDNMMETFQQVVMQVTSTADGVGHEIELMSNRSDSLNDLIRSQQNSLETVSASVTQMSASAEEVSTNADVTAKTTEDANAIGQRGLDVVAQSISNIQDLSHQLNVSQQTINDLEKDVASIGGILAVIEGIAEQTNLLALNAAIEAARAGEQGRGFAVVADEVRSLASRTQESTVEIRQTIEGLQSRTTTAVSAMKKSISVSSSSVEQAQSTSDAISDICRSLHEIMDLTQLIATASKEQSIASADISTQLSNLSNSSFELLQLANENKDGGHRMFDQGEELKSSISIFKL
ncbi:methyl-accepting chemotaxis protein [Catenovulum maritimum]|uniref:Chemotaxis protein n=1 Tax=Catenovulum maritimum TaxID=1513271 RepID=A0A0J8GNX6_9ALTE|nr:methyl-accepting chemotaxis protein [Catenovulum maritimum]KMT64500.1 hypothetical protein XM47_13635 [Catenovulum maritimum]